MLSGDVTRSDWGRLERFFAPKTVAVIGATETGGSVGRTVFWNLISNPFGGTVFPVNPKRSSVLGIKAYPNIAAVPEKVDLVVIALPAPTVPGVIGECVDAGVPAAVIISAGFKEMGAPGLELERQIMEQAGRNNMRIVGPNCLGVMSPLSGLNATFAAGMARPGNVAFLSQSGALGTAVLDWSLREQVGFSAFASLGSMLDVGWGDLIDYLGDDPRTQSIVIYMESIGDARSFLSAAREVALTKPIIVIKAGRTEAAAKAAASHTGAMTGSDAVLEAAFRRVGVLRVDRIEDLFSMAEVLAKQPRPKGPRLTILTNAGGPGVLATDALIGGGGELTKISDETFTALNGVLPAQWSRSNPVDILGDAKPERYAKALEIAGKDPNADGLLVILTPQDMTEPTQTAEALKAFGHLEGKPVLASWMGGPIVQAGEDILNRANIPTFQYPDTAVRAFNYMWRYSYNLRGLYETPTLELDNPRAAKARSQASELIDRVQESGRTLLTELESKQLLATYNIPTVPTHLATTRDEAVRMAEKIGFPVVLKLHSNTITHKTDVGGVQLNLIKAQGVEKAFDAILAGVTEKAGKEHFNGVTVQPMVKLEGYELILGSSVDPQFGPVLLFGSGGQLVEVYKDRALSLPPLTSTLARRMMEQTKIYTALKGVRGRKSVDISALEQLLVRFSYLVVEDRRIKEIDINPLVVSPNGLLALDARVVLYEKSTPASALPKPAIRAYPVQYVTTVKDQKDGTAMTIRPIRPEDEPGLVRFHETLSERSVRLRYFHFMRLGQRVAHERLIRQCFSDFDREMALVIEREVDGKAELLGIGRLSRERGGCDAELAVVVSDVWQKCGLGSQLMKQLLHIAKEEKLRKITATILPENREMVNLCQRFGFAVEHGQDEVRATLQLG
ncbi:MAG TPA: bifunctional acetate--CoA ligase family protein/GNAT family N-acetyltransferase [Tepidisphaeraceae bacterium]|jgi:acetyltransferase